MVGRCISYWSSPFLGDMLVFGGVYEFAWINSTKTPTSGTSGTSVSDTETETHQTETRNIIMFSPFHDSMGYPPWN